MIMSTRHRRISHAISFVLFPPPLHFSQQPKRQQHIHTTHNKHHRQTVPKHTANKTLTVNSQYILSHSRFSDSHVPIAMSAFIHHTIVHTRKVHQR